MGKMVKYKSIDELFIVLDEAMCAEQILYLKND